MRVTSKGQVTIPGDVREKAGLLPGTEVEFKMVKGKVVVEKAEGSRRRGEALVNALKGKGGVKMTTEEIMSLTRGDK